MASILPARNCTIRPAAPGLRRAASAPHAGNTLRPCCPTAKCLWQEDMLAVPTFLPARNCTIQPLGQMEPGLLRAASTPAALITQRPCCPTARSWSQEDLIAVSILPRARNCSIRPVGQMGPGLLLAA